MARTADFDLARELAKPSFTPAVRDAAALVELIAAGDEPTATRAAPALAGLGDPARAAIDARLAVLDALAPAADHAAASPSAGSVAAAPGPIAAAATDARDRAAASPTAPPASSTRGAAVARDHGKPRGKHAAGNHAPSLAGGHDGAKARLIGVLGLLARAGDAAARAQLIARTGDPAARARKAAAIALGKLGGDDARDALVARWDAGDAAPDERRALAEALGKLGGDGALARLKALDAGDDAELVRRRDRAVLMADRSARRDASSVIAGDVAPPSPITIQLGCRPGLGPLLCQELAALGITARPLGDRGAELRLAQPLATLFASRLWATAAIPIALAAARGADHARPAPRGPADSVAPRAAADSHAPRATDSHGAPRAADSRAPRGAAGSPGGSRGVPGAPKSRAALVSSASSEPEALAAAITQTLTSPAVLALLQAWTRGPIRWRLGFASGHKRAIVWRVARDVTAAVPALINDPTATTWDVLVDDDTRLLSLVPRRIDDPRFAYRVAEVPAASHPTVAAALALLAAPKPGDRAWDPFCGSGLELVERARSGPVGSLLGTDVDAEALAAARANLDAAGVTAELAIADARDHVPGGAPGQIDLILTNPPLGSRVQLDATALLIAALPNFARALAPGGRLVWITPAPRKTAPVAEQLGLIRTHAYPVDLGGVRGQLERWNRR